MRNFIIVLFALGLIGCVGCSETESTWYGECGISRTEAVSISLTGLGDGWSAACSYTQEDLDPTDRCNKPHYSLCEYYWCLASYPEIVARMNVCVENHQNGNGDVGTVDTGMTDTGRDTFDYYDVFGGDVETDAGTDTQDANDDDTNAAFERAAYFEAECVNFSSMASYIFEEHYFEDGRVLCEEYETQEGVMFRVDACESFCDYWFNDN